MTDETMEEEMRMIISEHLGVSLNAVHSKARFIEDLGADSLDTVELVMALEEKFEIEITDEDAETIPTVGAAVDLIIMKVQNNRAKLSPTI